MSDDDDTPGAAQAAPVPIPEASRGWSEQDRRTLYITVGGTLAANVGTVLIVGLALAIVHGGGRHSSQAIAALILAVLGSGGLVFGIAVRRGRLPDLSSVSPRVRLWWSWPIIALGSLLVVEAALVITGVAAAVK